MTDKVSPAEEEWIQEHERKIIERFRTQLEERKREAERRWLKELHWMRCPKCGQELETIKHDSVSIEKCVSCEGIWLDKGELETIIVMEVEEQKGFFHGLRRLFA